jgi:hypothetical protein
MMSSKLFTKIIFASLLVTGAFFIFAPSHSSAAVFNYSDHLMDNDVMRANNTMTANDIQVFLSNQGSGLAAFTDIEDCGSTGGAHYSFYATYYACGGRRSAAQIIYDAGQAYGINPQVILATLQKEQSLITTPNPAPSQLNYAMGYGCPDSGGCSYPGFFNQVDNGAWQFRVDMELSSGNNYWGYGPSSYPCNGPTRYYSAALKAGNNVVFMDDYGNHYAQFILPNAATATLYCYTPHVYPGSGAQYYSGSYWFVRYFNQWFTRYAWDLVGQYAYTDSNKTTPANLSTMLPGQRVYIGFQVKNRGNFTWTNSGPNPVNVGTLRPASRASAFFDDTWLGPNRPAHMLESSVSPGQTATFEFWIKAPNIMQASNYNEYFGILQEGIDWMPDIGMYFGIGVRPLTYTWASVGQYAYTDSNKTTPASLANMSPGQRVYVGIAAKNTGTATWLNSGPNPVDVGTSYSLDRRSEFATSSNWLGPSRPARLQQSSVAPGQVGNFEFWMTAPATLGGNFVEHFDLVAEGHSWMPDIGLTFSGSLLNPNYSWSLLSQYAYTNSSKTTPAALNNLTLGQTAFMGVTIKNTGNVTWYNSGTNIMNLGTARDPGHASPFYTLGWPGYGRPARMIESSVAPGQTATFEFTITAPGSGNYKEYLVPVSEGYTWLNDIGLYFGIRVL